MVGCESYNKEDEETKNKYEKITCMSPRGERFKEELLSKIVPWENITESLQHFPYYLEQNAKALLTECVASHLKQIKLRRKYVEGLESSNDRVLLRSIAGMGRYMERLVSAVAREMQVPLLKFDVDHDYVYKEFDDNSDYDRYELDENELKFQKGDRVEYDVRVSNSSGGILSRGQRGEVYEVDGDRVLVVFNTCELAIIRAAEASAKAILIWLDVDHVKKVKSARTHDCFISMEALYEVLVSHQQPLIVYFPDSHMGLPSKSSNYSYSNTKEEFVRKVNMVFNQSPEGVVMICRDDNCNKWEAKSQEMKKFPESLRNYVERLEGRRRYWGSRMCSLFTNVVSIKPPKDQVLVNKFLEQIEEDRLAMISENNLRAVHKVFKAYNLSCMNLEQSHFEDVILTAKRVEKIVGWATSHYLSSCDLPCVSEGKLHISLESIKLAALRLKGEEPWCKKQSYLCKKVTREEKTQPMKTTKNYLQNLASNVHERHLVRAVVCSEDIGLKFDDVGALESVKKPLFETVILPMWRPELFSCGNLLRPCQGILLYGPPGTGKTLIAKALAAESGANFINVTAAAITSRKKNRETERDTRAIFSYAIKLAPAIVYVDEDDTLLIPHGHNKHDTIRLNEFISAWDALNNPGILVIVSTNRPYDLDEAVIRRATRSHRIYVGLPDAENRRKILKALLKKENLESEFSFEKLAEATEGYSGSDLKNLCCAAAYRPIQEFVEQESKGEGVGALRPINLNDFNHRKSMVRAAAAQYASSIRKMREWNEQCVEAESTIWA